MILTIFQDKILSGQFFLLAYAFSFQVIFNILFSMSQRVGKDIFHFTGMVSNLLFFKMSIYCFMYILIKVIIQTYLLLFVFTIQIRLAQFELIHNLFVATENETANSPINGIKVLHKGQRAFQTPFLIVYYFLFITC